MAKVDIEAVEFIAGKVLEDEKAKAQIMRELQQLIAAEAEEKAKQPPATKKQFGIVLSDPNGELAGKDIVGWVVQIPEEDSLATIPDRIHQAAYDFNATPRGRRLPVETIGEACEAVGARFFKDHNIWVKTKVPVLAIATANTLPKEVSE